MNNECNLQCINKEITVCLYSKAGIHLSFPGKHEVGYYMSKISYTWIHAYVYTPTTQEMMILIKANITIKTNTYTVWILFWTQAFEIHIIKSNNYYQYFTVFKLQKLDLQVKRNFFQMPILKTQWNSRAVLQHFHRRCAPPTDSHTNYRSLKTFPEGFLFPNSLSFTESQNNLCVKASTRII